MLVNTRLNENENQQSVSFKEAVLNPAAKHGGLYAPAFLPKLKDNFFEWAIGATYAQIALEIISKFGLGENEIFKKAVQRYTKFDNKAVEIIQIGQNIFMNELWHGPTRAFKDMALQPFGVIVDEFAKQDDKKYLIMCATSGDTGPATLETFAGCENVQVVCLYPLGGTSEIQKLQMVTQDASNLHVIGIEGNFDDAQKALKMLLNDDDFKASLKDKNLSLSAANSVNFGRILFQIIYHIYACIKINGNEEPLNIIVPSGNFGDALGAYYAKKMGANIDKIGIASNANNVLTDFIKKGIYDIRTRKLQTTISPAMDILISSNVERLLFDLFGAVRTKELMQNLNENKYYELNKDELAHLQEVFFADFSTDNECAQAIKYAASQGKLIDPHTATCFKMIDENTINVITSTAQWVKFTPSMIKAIKNKDCVNEKDEMNELANEFKVIIPNQISSLFTKDQCQKTTAKTDELKQVILGLLK